MFVLLAVLSAAGSVLVLVRVNGHEQESGKTGYCAGHACCCCS